MRHPFNPELLSSKSYREIYTLTTLYNDRTFIQVQMVVSNIGLCDGNAACEMLVLHSGEKSKKTFKRFKKSCWKFSDRPNPTLSIGPCCLIQEGESTKCVIMLDDNNAEISLDRPPKSEKLSDTIFPRETSNKFYTNEVIIPWTRLRATLKMSGSYEKHLKGFGMLEHSRSVGYPKDFSRGGIAFYGCQGTRLFLANFNFPAGPKRGGVGWVWDNRDQAPKPMTDLQMVMNGTNRFPKEGILPIITAPLAPFIIAGQQGLFKLSLIDDIGPFLGFIAKIFIGNPVTRFYWAQARVSPDQPPIEGVLEIMNYE